MDSPGPQGVPRFSSFRPPFTPPAAATGSEREDGRRSGHRRRADKSPHSSRRHRHRSKYAGSEAGYDGQGASRYATESEEKQEVRGPGIESNESNAQFVIDTRGDPDNLRYGTNKYQVPTYHRFGGGSVVGAPGMRITMDSRHQDAFVLQDAAGSAGSKPLSSAALSALALNLPIRVHAESTPDTASEQATVDHLQDFISTEILSQADITAKSNADDYRSIQTLAKPGEEVTTEDSQGHRITHPAIESDILQRNAELNRVVESHPTDITAWLCLAEHQELVITGSRYDDRPLSRTEKQLVARAKLSIYERGIKVNPKNPKLDLLLLGRMEEGAKFWDTTTLNHEWGDMLACNSEFITLWVEYLDFRQTESQHFSFDKCFETYTYCLELNSSFGFGDYKNQVRSYLLLRLTLFLRESGHSELAVGLWQAVLELTCFRPAHLKDQEQTLEEFEKFWVPEHPRLGERGWTGWNSTEPSIRTAVDNGDSKLNADLTNLFGTWVYAERDRIVRNRMPSHTFDENKEDGAYRVVLPIDCKQILPHFWDCTNNLDPLIGAFLFFCHLPSLTVPCNIRNTRLWSGDNFLRNEYMDDSQNTIADWIHFQNYAETTTIQPFAFPHHNFIHTTDTLFADPKQWFSSFSKWAEICSRETSVVDPEFVRMVLYALVDQFPEKELAEYAIALTFAYDKDEGKRYGKHVLKSRPSELRLYNAVALMHWRTGDHDFALNVWSNAISMCQNFESAEIIESALLWNSWIWELLHSAQDCQATYLLQAMSYQRVDMLSYNTADATELNASSFLRLQKYLFSAQQSAFALQNPQAYRAYTDCYALVLYFMGEPLGSVLQVYDDAVDALNVLQEDVKVFTGELLHQTRARLIYFWVDTRRGQYKPAEIREQFLESMQWWPHNTIFLSLFKWNDARVNLMDRTRDILEVTTGYGPKSPNFLTQTHRVPITTHLFSIYIEMGRPVVLGSTTHSIRAAFERAIGDANIPLGKTPTRKHSFELTSSTSAHNNLTLWRLYILFELYGEYNIPRARELFFRALSSCPWSKELYMLGFEHLRADLTAALPPCRVNSGGQANPPGFDYSELRALYTEMLRRGLRVHHHVEDFWSHQGEEDEVS